ncbi:hypothetical protein KQX54_016299 [Cotesia glomerata]|uniref:Uncharacterized protein n=1 Tax=Cotesia glomerata TaxID=32391 RepID=A0AAV7HXL6_COTGL|nr:hypothetical protein KQX54_016299 [Cotesia glomerata]
MNSNDSEQSDCSIFDINQIEIVLPNPDVSNITVPLTQRSTSTSGKEIPRSQLIKNFTHKISRHTSFCEEQQCHEYLGTDNNILARCRYCHSKIDRKSNNGSFLYLSLTDQLREVFEMTDAHHLYSKSRQKRSPYAVEDLFDGKAYKKVMVSDDLISINFNVDGAPIFEKLQYFRIPCVVHD